MGNKTSTSAKNHHPAAPPPLLSAAVTGDFGAFSKLWNDNNENERLVRDRQDNNVLHAAFSCRIAGRPDDIVRLIHETMSPSLSSVDTLVQLYQARNQLGCNPLWILIAYGNVDLLKLVVNLAQSNSSLLHALSALAMQPNDQGDTPLLATCSQGNVAMVQYLIQDAAALWLGGSNNINKKETETSSVQSLLTQPNQKGTTPLQIATANGHVELLQYLLQVLPSAEEHVWQVNAAGLSLFHICSERNFATGLRALLDSVFGNQGNDTENDALLNKVWALKDHNGANPLHVACFCGNTEAVQVWVQAVNPTKKLPATTAAVKLLDATDGQGRTAYWIAGVQGHDKCQELLAEAGVQTQKPAQMVQEIAQARERREQRKKTTINNKSAIDGNALLRG